MNTFSPQISLPVNPSGGGGFNRKATPGDVGDSLFNNFLQQVDEQDDDGVLTWLPLAVSRDDSGGGAGKGLAVLGLDADRVMVSGNDLSKLARVLERQGFSSKEIHDLLQSLADKNGDIRVGRLLAKLRALFQEKTETASSHVVNRRDIPRLEEALFKMGLGAGEVREAVEKAGNTNGDLSVRGFISALRNHFPDLTAEMEKRLQGVVQQETGIRFRSNDLRQIVKDGGLEAELNRLTGNASEAARDAAKKEIAALMQERGIPLEDVKRFLESLRIRQTGSQDSLNSGWRQGAAEQKNPSPPGGDPSVRVYIRRDGADWEQGGWKGRILDILNRQDTLAGRRTGTENGGGKTASFQELARMLEDALSGRNASKQKGEKAGQAPFPWTDRKPLAGGNGESPSPSSAEGGKASSKTGVHRSDTSAESTQSRSPSGAEFSLSRADRTSAPQQAGAVRATAAAVNLPEPLPKIVDRMIWMVRAGEQTSRIQISPPDLGRLELDIVIRQGHLHANLNAENPAVKELIEANLQQLKQQLNNLGLVVERFEVAAGLSDRRFAESQAQFNGRKGRNAQGRTPGAGAGDDNAPPVRAVHRPNGGLYRIDLHV
ncbi:MAG: flagellar hook-length control protein FliK [Deltaproteobacteria bacterium]|nr:flagellar hook-length control protein FliK [Deltaproteobacteria bacterium]